VQEQVDESPEGHALITVGITCFSEGDWVLECWHSVLAQTDNRWVAVLVMDGGASARTREVFEQLNHPKLRKFKESVVPFRAFTRESVKAVAVSCSVRVSFARPAV